ncbi:MAG: hypothetical protein GY694_01845 [Gammaproteobacteria bacterium]|nr:hypothetical protein [Gammaproteobacteria bacterium]
MKKIFLLLLILISFSVNAMEVQFKLITLNVPNDELMNVLVTDSDLLLMAQNWEMYFSDAIFTRDCDAIKKKISNIDCTKKNRINLLTEIMANNKLNELFLGTTSEKKAFKIQHQSFIEYEMFYALSHKSSTIFLIDKDSGKTYQVNGKFKEKHLDMFVLKKGK